METKKPTIGEILFYGACICVIIAISIASYRDTIIKEQLTAEDEKEIHAYLQNVKAPYEDRIITLVDVVIDNSDKYGAEVKLYDDNSNMYVCTAKSWDSIQKEITELSLKRGDVIQIHTDGHKFWPQGITKFKNDEI